MKRPGDGAFALPYWPNDPLRRLMAGSREAEDVLLALLLLPPRALRELIRDFGGKYPELRRWAEKFLESAERYREGGGETQ
jgi:hypothetical protein